MSVVPLRSHSDSASQQPALRPFPTRSVFPQDAEAVIYKPAPSAMTSGRAHLHQWKLRFERRSPPYVEPLMGWTAGGDTLDQVELSFATVEAAIGYARRQGLRYTVQGLPKRNTTPRLVSDNAGAESKVSSTQRRRRLEWVERTLGPDIVGHRFDRGVDPTAVYADPQQVLRDDGMSPDRKRDALSREAARRA